MSVAKACAVLVGFNSFLPLIPMPEGSDFIDSLSCASGRVTRIELLGQAPDPSDEAPMPCHAVCARDDDDPAPGKTPQTKG